jgi:hypothetical protein
VILFSEPWNAEAFLSHSVWQARQQKNALLSEESPALKKKLLTEKCFPVYTFSMYLCKNIYPMKILSLKLDDEIFNETEAITAKMKLARNRYINEAVNLYNLYNRKKLLKKQLAIESKLTREDSMEILREFEQLMDED